MKAGLPTGNPAAPAPNPAPARRRIVIVLGMHRSGTSLCANMLHALGVDIADAAGPSANNQRGHWERPRINDLHDAILALYGRGWASPTHHLALPDYWWTDPRIEPIRRNIITYLERSATQERLFGFKDPRTSRLLPLWPSILEALDLEPIYIFCIRNPAQVARSITARDQLAGDEAAYRWLVYNAQAVHGAGRARVCVIGYETWFTEPAATLGRLAGFVGLPVRPDCEAIVDGSLRHDALGAPGPVSPLASRLHREIAGTNEQFSDRLLDLVDTVLECERAVMPFLRDAALLPLSLGEQNRVIQDLQALVAQLRQEVKSK